MHPKKPAKSRLPRQPAAAPKPTINGASAPPKLLDTFHMDQKKPRSFQPKANSPRFLLKLNELLKPGCESAYSTSTGHQEAGFHRYKAVYISH